MKHLQTFLILTLALALVVLYISSRRSIDSLKRRIVSLESRITLSNDECETKIAYLKAAYAQRIQKDPVPAQLGKTENPLGGLIGKLSAESAKKRRETLSEMSGTLGLSADQLKRMAEILDDFRRSKKAIGDKAKNEKIPVFDNRYLEMINKARSDAMGKIRIILGDDLYENMIEKGYDLRLGLRSVDQASLR